MTRHIRPSMTIVAAHMYDGIDVASLSTEATSESHARLGNVIAQCAIGNAVSAVHASAQRQ